MIIRIPIQFTTFLKSKPKNSFCEIKSLAYSPEFQCYEMNTPDQKKTFRSKLDRQLFEEHIKKYYYRDGANH